MSRELLGCLIVLRHGLGRKDYDVMVNYLLSQQIRVYVPESISARFQNAKFSMPPACQVSQQPLLAHL